MRMEKQESGQTRYHRDRWTEWFVCRVTEGQPLPRGYGFAWIDAHAAQAVVMPVGVNIIAGWLHRTWFAVQLGLHPTYLERWLQAQGQSAAKDGYGRAVQDVQRQLEERFGERVKAEFAGLVDAGEEVTAEDLGTAAAAATEHEGWTQEERVFFNAAVFLAERKGIALFFSCQDPRCAQQPILSRVNGEGGFWLACFHKRRWVPDPPAGTPGHLSRRALARLGVH